MANCSHKLVRMPVTIFVLFLFSSFPNKVKEDSFL